MNFFESLDSMDNTIESAPIGLKISTIEYSFDSFLQKISDGVLSDVVIQNNIRQGLSQYLNYDNFKNPGTSKQFIGLWTNKRFLSNLLEILNTDKSVLSKVRSLYTRTINVITYDYYAEQFNKESSVNWDSEVCNLLISISTTVNYNYILPMTTIIPPNNAVFIAMSRFSSFDNTIAIKRFNDMIIGSGIDLSIKDIIYIYSIFFSEKFSSLFNITMTTVTKSFADTNQKKIYDNISLAMIYIVNSIPSTEIETVLKKYSLYISFLDKKCSRFSFRNLSEEFSRINIVVNKLLEEGYDIP